jgi:hypothetical protein
MQALTQPSLTPPFLERRRTFEWKPAKLTKIVVEQITRTKSGRVSVAGIDLANQKHLRPVLPYGMSQVVLQSNGGPFDIGNVVDLGESMPDPQKPKVEDHLFQISQTTKMRQADANGFWDLLASVSRRDLASIFGDELVVTSETEKAFLPAFAGRASLGCLIPLTSPECFVDTWGKLRIAFLTRLRGREVRLRLALSDIRFFNDDNAPYEDVVDYINARMNIEYVILGLGVALSQNASPFYPHTHWLTVNSVHLSGNPLWQHGRC